MSKPRVELQQELENVMQNDHVYFQPPATTMIHYPCIIYTLSNDKPKFANNNRYWGMNRYSAILIDKDPDSRYLKKILQRPYCSFDRTYTADNLNHFVFTIYY